MVCFDLAWKVALWISQEAAFWDDSLNSFKDQLSGAIRWDHSMLIVATTDDHKIKLINKRDHNVSSFALWKFEIIHVVHARLHLHNWTLSGLAWMFLNIR